MISFVNFARIASICVGFDLGTLHGYFFSQRLLAKFEFPARISNKTCLNILENSPFRRSVVDTQVSQKMIFPKKTLDVM